MIYRWITAVRPKIFIHGDMAKKLRYILFPFAVIYGFVVKIRNFLFDRNIFHSVEFDLPVISVGNLSTGGTGKTPAVEYLVELLRPVYKIVTLSRGYKRRTRGFIMAGEHVRAEDIGDEPMQFFVKYKDIDVAVSEDRLVAIPQILQLKPKTQVVILDDAFQHRRVRAGLSILLTPLTERYTQDYFLPAGNLRDSRRSAARADVIIVTKCDPKLSVPEKDALLGELSPKSHQKVFFTSYRYGTPYHLFEQTKKAPDRFASVLLVAGIADPAGLLATLKERAEEVRLIAFADHHAFGIEDIRRIQQLFKEIKADHKMIVTTEKDAVRLMKYRQELSALPVYVIPVRHSFLFEEGTAFNEIVFDFIKKYTWN